MMKVLLLLLIYQRSYILDLSLTGLKGVFGLPSLLTEKLELLPSHSPA